MTISRKAEAKLALILGQWSKAIALACQEHGRPNSFGVVELASEYNLRRADGYRLGRERVRDLNLWLNVRHDGAWNITYRKGRFHAGKPAQ